MSSARILAALNIGEIADPRELGRREGLKEAANWLRRNANAESEPKAKAALIEAHNAILKLAEGA